MRGALFGVMVCTFLICCSTPPTNRTDNPEIATQHKESRTVSINSPDGVKLAGTLWESSSAKSPSVLMLHQWQSDRHSYVDVAEKLSAKGFSVLAIDGRGFGDSIIKADGNPVTADRSESAVRSMIDDVDAAFDFLSKQTNVDPARVGIVGASYGSSLAIMYAADHPKVSAVAMLSPGLNYFGNMQTEPAVRKYGDRPLLMAAASDDPDSADAVSMLGKALTNNRKVKAIVLPSGGHGTALLKNASFETSLISFLVESLMPPDSSYK
jgi:dienelactone hydrolase